MESIKNGAKKGINEWVKEVKHNKEFAEKFKGVKTVKGILRIAHENGFSFTAKELENCNLNDVAGGAMPGGVQVTVNPSTDVHVQHVGFAATNAGNQSTVTATPTININK